MARNPTKSNAIGSITDTAVNAINPTSDALRLAAGVTALGLAVTKFEKQKSDLNAFGNSLYFPNDLGSEKYPYYISFGFREYQRRSIFDRVFMKDVGMIRLPMPNQLVDSNDVDFSLHDHGLIVGALTEGLLHQSKAISDITTNKLAQVGAQIAQGAGGALAGALAGLGTNNNTLQLAGYAQNPFMTVLFKAPKFKQHQFNWTLNAANSEESETLRAIVNKFKYHQAPDIAPNTAGVLLTYPDIVMVNLYPTSKYLYDFKPCVLQSLSVNYSSDNQPAFFGLTDAPVTVRISMNLLEIEYWTKKEILNPEFEQ